MTVNLARLAPDTTLETLDHVMTNAPRAGGFEQDHVERLFHMAEQLGTLNVLGVTEVCVAL